MVGLAYITDVTTIELDETKCNGCRMCMNVCPHPVFEVSDRIVQLSRPDACIECGACVLNCAEGALSVRPGAGCAAAILLGWLTRSKSHCSCG